MALIRLGWDIIRDVLPLVLKHNGNRSAIAAELEAERDWARFCAAHGLPRRNDAP